MSSLTIALDAPVHALRVPGSKRLAPRARTAPAVRPHLSGAVSGEDPLNELEQRLTQEHRRENPWIDDRALARLVYGDVRLTGLMNRLKRADPGLCVRVLAASVLREDPDRPLVVATLVDLDREVLLVGTGEIADLDDWRLLPDDVEALDPVSGQAGPARSVLSKLSELSDASGSGGATHRLTLQPLLRCVQRRAG